MVISVICYVMIRGITNGIVTSVICYVMLSLVRKAMCFMNVDLGVPCA
jgi:hypothetical protein